MPFSLYLNICRLRTGTGKFFMGYWEVLDFFCQWEWEPCISTGWSE